MVFSGINLIYTNEDSAKNISIVRYVNDTRSYLEVLRSSFAVGRFYYLIFVTVVIRVFLFRSVIKKKCLILINVLICKLKYNKRVPDS